MLKIVLTVFWCVFFYCLLDCKGSPIADPQVNQTLPQNEFQPKGISMTNPEKIQQLYSLLNESFLIETLSRVPILPNLQIIDSPEMSPNVLSVQTSTERLYTSKPNFGGSDKDNLEPQESGLTPQVLTISLPLEQTAASQEGVQELVSNRPITKSPLEYQSQKQSYASAPGGISGGHLGQLIPLGDPLPAGPSMQNITIEDRLKDTTTTISVQKEASEKLNTKSPLEYQSQKPSYASAPGGISGGHLGQLIPLGDPLPAGPSMQAVTIKNRVQETTTIKMDQEVLNEKPSTKSPLEYQSLRPTYAGSPGGISGGHLGQLIPSGDPLPAGPLVENITIEDRLKETTTTATVQKVPSEKPNTKPPIEYQSQKPSHVSESGDISGGHLDQLIPFGDPLPVGPLVPTITTIDDRFKKTTMTTTIQDVLSNKLTTKSPLEYQSQKPSYASAPGDISGGHLGQLIPSGDPLPAGTSVETFAIQDRVKENTTLTNEKLPSLKPSTKLPWTNFPGVLEGIFGGQFGQLISSGNPLPAGVEKPKPDIVDRFQEISTMTSTSSTTVRQNPSTKSPLEYQNQRPSYAGGISGGNWGPLIPPGKPWPADPVTRRPILEDRFKETTTMTSQQLSTQKSSTKSPLEYSTQRPSFAGLPGGISGGHLDTLVPPGKPWPADKQTQRPVLEDRFQETTTIATLQERPSQKPIVQQSPLEYEPQRPSFVGSTSGGHFGQLIPPGKPWPADKQTQRPVLEDRFQETTTITTLQERPSQKPIVQQSPLEYEPQKPSFVGSISGGNFGQLIPPGKPWPANPESQKPLLEDRFKETIIIPFQPSQSPQKLNEPSVEYMPQKPSFAGQMSSGYFGQLIPPGKPWPASK